jgi:hypothetical protein
VETKWRQVFSDRCKYLRERVLLIQSLQSIMGATEMRRSNSFIDKLFSEDRQCSRTLHRPSFPLSACDLKSLYLQRFRSPPRLANSHQNWESTWLQLVQNWHKKRVYQLCRLLRSRGDLPFAGEQTAGQRPSPRPVRVSPLFRSNSRVRIMNQHCRRSERLRAHHRLDYWALW